MKSVIEIRAFICTLKGWRWYCENRQLEDLLNSELSVHGPSGADPQPEITEGRRIAKKYGGKILQEVPYMRDAGTVY